MRTMFVALMLALSMSAAASADSPRPFILIHTFAISESGGFLNKTIKELGTEEAATIAAGVCQIYYGVDCTEEAQNAAKRAKWVSAQITKAGGHFITGQVKKHDGEQWWGNFYAPQGYRICSAGLDYGNMSISGGSTFNVTLTSKITANGSSFQNLSFYAVVQKNKQAGQSINARFAILYVPYGSLEEIAQKWHVKCNKHGTTPWQLKGQTWRYLITQKHIMDKRDGMISNGIAEVPVRDAADPN